MRRANNPHLNIGDQQKATSFPFQSGGVYLGTVLSVTNGVPTIRVLGTTFRNVARLGKTQYSTLSKNDQVLCTFINQETQDLYILGKANSSTDVFTAVEKFNALIDELESRLGLASNALDAFKQT
jgi:hypothetical protein